MNLMNNIFYTSNSYPNAFHTPYLLLSQLTFKNLRDIYVDIMHAISEMVKSPAVVQLDSLLLR